MCYLFGNLIFGVMEISGFGYCKDFFFGMLVLYFGIDFCGSIGDFVCVFGVGIVIFVGLVLGYGNMIEIDYGNGIIMCYGYFFEIFVCIG